MSTEGGQLFWKTGDTSYLPALFAEIWTVAYRVERPPDKPAQKAIPNAEFVPYKERCSHLIRHAKVKSIYVYRDQQEYGPYTVDELRNYVLSGNITEGDYARESSSTEWSTVQEILAYQNTPPVEAMPDASAPENSRLESELAPKDIVLAEKKKGSFRNTGFGCLALIAILLAIAAIISAISPKHTSQGSRDVVKTFVYDSAT